MLNHHHVRLFAAVAESGSFSAAAAKLRLSQPAISAQVRDLEHALGASLLERLPRGVRMTAAGDLLAGYARQIAGLEEEAERALADLQSLRQGRLRVGASMTIGIYLAPRLLVECRRRWPGVTISCDIANTEAIQQALLERRFDLGLIEGPGPHEAALVSQTFRFDELILIAPPRRWTSSGLHDLAALPWVMREPGSGTREVVLRALGRHGVPIQPAWTFNSPEAVKQAVMAGCGVAVVPRITVEAELNAGLLREHKVPGLVLRRRLRVQWLRHRQPSAAMTAFSGLLALPPRPAPNRRADS